MIKVDDFLFPFKIYLYILIGVIFILPTIIAVFFDLNNMIHMYTDIRRYNLVNPIQESTGYVRSNREQEHICDLIADRNIDGARKILDSHTEKSSTDIVHLIFPNKSPHTKIKARQQKPSRLFYALISAYLS